MIPQSLSVCDYALELDQEGILLGLRVRYNSLLTRGIRLDIYRQLGRFTDTEGDAVEPRFEGNELTISLPETPIVIEEAKFVRMLNALGVDADNDIPIRMRQSVQQGPQESVPLEPPRRIH